MDKLCVKVFLWQPLPFLRSAVLVTTGLSGGYNGKIGVGKFRIKSKSITVG